MHQQLSRRIVGIKAGVSTWLTIQGYPDADVRVWATLNAEPQVIIILKGIPVFFKQGLEKLPFIQKTKHKFRFR